MIAYTPLHGVGARSVEPCPHARRFHAAGTPSRRNASPTRSFRRSPSPTPRRKARWIASSPSPTKLQREPRPRERPRRGSLVRSLSPTATELSGSSAAIRSARCSLITCSTTTPKPTSAWSRPRSSAPSSSAFSRRSLAPTIARRSPASSGSAMQRLDYEHTHGGRFVMGYEEALGYSVGPLVRDKDGVSAADHLRRARRVESRSRQARCSSTSMTSIASVGLFVTEQVSLTKPGADGHGGDQSRDEPRSRSSATDRARGAWQSTTVVDLLEGAEAASPRATCSCSSSTVDAA